MEQNDIIKAEDLDTLLKELASWVQSEVMEADSGAHSSSASNFFREEMKGCARGKAMIGNELISKIRNRFLGDQD